MLGSVMAVGHNGGPLDRRLTDKEYRALSRLLLFSRLPGNQKLLILGAAVAADDNGEATMGAEDAKRVCSVNKRDTVFAAKKAVAENGIGILSTVSSQGKANRYRIMPPSVVASIVEAYNNRVESEKEPVPKMETSLVPKRGTSPVPQNGTGRRPEKGDGTHPAKGTGPIPQNGTSPENGDGLTKESFPHTPFKENNNINNLASVGDNSAREAGQLAILNGAKAIMVDQLATWLSPYAPDTVTAEKWLVTATTMHGGPVVKEAFGELQAQIASGDLIGRPIVVLNRICERIKKRPAQNREGKSPSRDEAMRLINTIAGGKR